MKNEIISFKNLSNQINNINQLKDEIEKASFEELAVGYECLKPYEKSVAELTKSVRDEIVKNKFESRNVGIKLDKNGNKTYANLILTERKSINLDKKYAKELLKKTKLQSKALEKLPKISDLREFLDALKCIIPEEDYINLEDVYVQYSVEVNDEKYKDLILNEEIDIKTRELLKEAYVETKIPTLNIAKSR